MCPSGKCIKNKLVSESHGCNGNRLIKLGRAKFIHFCLVARQPFSIWSTMF